MQAARQGIYSDTKTAVQSLFSAARAPKRSKILSFAGLVESLDDHLRFPTAIPEKLGLPLAAALQERPGFARRLVEALQKAAPEDAVAERAVLEWVLKGQGATRPGAGAGEELSPGVMLKAGRNGVILSGAGVDGALIKDLRTWISSRQHTH